MKLSVELVWSDDKVGDLPSIHLAPDGRIILEGAPLDEADRAALGLDPTAAHIAVDRAFIEAIKQLL
jgi:hypothetical protein